MPSPIRAWLQCIPGPALGPGYEEGRGIVAIALAALAVVALGSTGRTLLAAQATEPAVAVSGSYQTTSDSWLEQLTNPSAWSGGQFRHRQRPLTRAEEREERLREEREAREERLRAGREAREERMENARALGRERGTYRTVCVRLCDGFFFPISFSTTPDRFAADEIACRSRCSSSARLYVYPNPGGEPEEMTDIRGEPYAALKTAFLFRTSYDAGCTCKPHPWEEAELNRHRVYADRAQGRKRAVTAKVQPEPTPASLALSPPPASRDVPPSRPARARRPSGAMLVGASDVRPARASKRQPRHQARRTVSRQSSSDGGDWRRRAFSND